jgi:hypothetical protein
MKKPKKKLKKVDRHKELEKERQRQIIKLVEERNELEKKCNRYWTYLNQIGQKFAGTKYEYSREVVVMPDFDKLPTLVQMAVSKEQIISHEYETLKFDYRHLVRVMAKDETLFYETESRLEEKRMGRGNL